MFNYILYRIGEFIALHVPLKIGYFLAAVISDLHYIFAFKDKTAVRENLKAIFPQMNNSQIKQMRIHMFRNFAKYLVDFFRASEIDRSYIEEKVKIENIKYVDEALTRKKGVILLTAHLGNWELGGLALGLLGYPFWAVALPHKHKKVNDFFNAQREGKGVHVIPLGRAYRVCLRVMNSGEIVALVGDREFSKQGGVTVKFFDKDTIFPEGPAALSLRTGALIVPVFIVRNDDDTFTLRFEKAIDTRGKEMIQIINTYKEIIEDYIRKHPQQWYMFRRFWV